MKQKTNPKWIKPTKSNTGFLKSSKIEKPSSRADQEKQMEITNIRNEIGDIISDTKAFF